jgi:3-oxoacyl-[acyl-carrier protein] reductase
VVPIRELAISNTLRASLLSWSKTLSTEVAAQGVTSNIIVPGKIATARLRFLDKFNAEKKGLSAEEVAQRNESSIPMKRYGTPEEYAAAAAFLVSERASYITGSVIRVDGGAIPSV